MYVYNENLLLTLLERQIDQPQSLNSINPNDPEILCILKARESKSNKKERESCSN